MEMWRGLFCPYCPWVRATGSGDLSHGGRREGGGLTLRPMTPMQAIEGIVVVMVEDVVCF